MSVQTAMVTALVRLRGALQEARLPLELPGADEQRAAQTEMVDQLEDYGAFLRAPMPGPCSRPALSRWSGCSAVRRW